MLFADLIQDYVKEYKVIRDDGHWDQGDWVDDGPTEYNMDLCIMNLTEKDLRNYEGGKYTTKDIKIFAIENSEAEIIDTGQILPFQLEEGDIIEYQNNKYKIQDEDNQTNLSDFYKYMAKKVVVE